MNKISGLIARDSTGWQEEFAEGVKKHGYGVMWKDVVSDLHLIIPQLKELIKKNGHFLFYIISRGIANYRMRIDDFATKDTYEQIKNKWSNLNPFWFNDSFDGYANESQSAVIVFLVSKVDFLNENNRIPIDNFITYNEKQPSVKNAVAYTNIITENMKTIDVLTTNYNLILTGAPGTGKTYLARQIAAQMILGKEYDQETASDDEKKKMKEQCGFVQFHPSYDYTDFVEGLRPITDNNRNVGFERCDGVFKSFCKDTIKHSTTQSNAKKMLEWCKNNFPNQPLKSIGSNKEISFELEDGKIYAIASSGNKHPVNDDRIIFFLQTQEYNPGETYAPTIGKYILDNYSDDNEKSPYVFIIDEINRGEISKIFGELFFSIDPGYRGTAGRVKTQYQKLVKKDDVFYNGFYVPENVYIIGTMNDIDRSVESMDFAFRRRFAFKEVTAKDSQQMLSSEPALSEKVDEIIGRMNALNEAICPIDKNNSNKKGIEGLSSAYHIGASYFLKLTNYKKDDGTFDYDKLWDYHLKGLLFEYLRGMQDAEVKLDALRKAFDNNSSDSTQS